MPTQPRPPEDYEIPREHLQHINLLCGNPEFQQQDKLHEAIVHQYYFDRCRADRLSIGMDQRDLWHLVCRAALRAEIGLPEPKVPTVAQLFKQKQLAHGNYVFCRWRGNTDVPGVLLGLKGGQALVRLLGDAEERTFADIDVKPAPEDWEPPQPKTRSRSK